MRRLMALGLALVAMAGALAGCKKPSRVRATATSEEESELRSVVHVADLRTSLQLLRGFHQVEANAWRWTAGRFSVTLRPPAYGARDGAWLMLKFAIADATIERLKQVQLAANVNGTPVSPETYAKPGEHVYRKEVPAAALKPEAVTVEFAVEPFLKAGQVEQRELGLIVSMVGLEAK
ncbi:MAG: hypothetical protein HY235_25865 [Acidobacteria bacterium]|nr:hypothetical protein [Acidobacteriota bacterium]